MLRFFAIVQANPPDEVPVVAYHPLRFVERPQKDSMQELIPGVRGFVLSVDPLRSHMYVEVTPEKLDQLIDAGWEFVTPTSH